ncbi:hypothetical protein M9Y10_030490 [Tritrichomonas musculus]|uniref:Uncharacterized protein n=1 Tax=Tritrichomonas musculus TaxID=1915356 RepID=A0ABR2H3D0_9EUKA
MISLLLSIVLSDINLSNFVDGLENVEYHVDQDSNKTHFYVTEENIFLFYQNIPNLEIKIQNGGREIRKFSNPYQLSKYSIIKISTNWSQFDPNSNYLIGLVNGQQCDYIFYSNSPNFSFPAKFFMNTNKCFYHFTKNSTIFIGEKSYPNFVFVGKKYQDLAMISHYNNINKIKKLSGMARVENSHKNILAEEDDILTDLEMTQGGGSFMLAFAIILNIVGFGLYLIFGLAFGAFGCDCSCSCCCCCKDFWAKHNLTNLDYDDRRNPFFTQTLEEFEAHEGKVENDERN